jgi:hypothetical protein
MTDHADRCAVRRDLGASLPRRAALTLLAAAVAVLGLAIPAAASIDADAETEFTSLLNGERIRRGLPALTVCLELRTPSRGHSKVMADTGTLHHNPDLRSLPGWQRIAENVGRGPSVTSIHAALMESTGHRANILDPQMTQVGIGVERRSGVWVTQVFRRPSSGATCTSPTQTGTALSSPTKAEPVVRLNGDFTGDGRADIATFDPADGRWLVASPGALASPRTWGVFSTRTGWSHHLVGDFDGDGRDDVASYHPGSGTWWVSRSTGSGFVPERWAGFSTRTGWSHHLVGDVDGDGRDDLISYHPGAGTWWVSRSSGRAFALERWGRFSTRTGWSHHLVGDVTGDGRDDLTSYHPGAGTWWVSRSTGAAFGLERWGRFSTGTGWTDHLVGDVDGDGRADVVSHHTGGRWWWQRSAGSGFDLHPA